MITQTSDDIFCGLDYLCMNMWKNLSNAEDKGAQTRRKYRVINNKVHQIPIYFFI